MTELLFREDAYRREAPARVLEAAPGRIVLDATLFYPQGGGQPGDRGELARPDGAAIPIVGTVYDADRKTIVHVPAEGAPLPSSATPSVRGSTGNCASSACAPIPRCISCRSCCPTP